MPIGDNNVKREARNKADENLRVFPKFSVKNYRKCQFLKKKFQALRHILRALGPKQRNFEQNFTNMERNLYKFLAKFGKFYYFPQAEWGKSCRNGGRFRGL